MPKFRLFAQTILIAFGLISCQTQELGTNVQLEAATVSQGEWTPKNRAPLALFEGQAISGVFNGEARTYVFGGFKAEAPGTTPGTNIPATNKVFAFKRGTWQTVMDLPSGIPDTHAGIARVGNTIYIAGGLMGNYDYRDALSVTNIVRRFDTVSEKFAFETHSTSIPNLPSSTAAGGMVAVTVSGKPELHFFGGVGQDVSTSRNTHWRYRSGERTWTQLNTSFPRLNHFGVAATTSPQAIFVFGGQGSYNYAGESSPRRAVWRYSFTSNSWSRVTKNGVNVDLPVDLGHTTYSTVVTSGRYVHILGGATDGAVEVDTVYTFDALNSQWLATGRLPAPRSSGIAGITSAGNFLFGTGRCDNKQANLCSDTSTIQPKAETWESQGR